MIRRCLLTVCLLIGGGSPASAQLTQDWQVELQRDPMNDSVAGTVAATSRGFDFVIFCNLNSQGGGTALAAVRAPLNSSNPSRTPYKIRFNSGEVVDRSARYGRRLGTQEKASIVIDDADFDRILDNGIESIAMEFTDSIFGRVVVSYPAIPAEASAVFALCRDGERPKF